MGERALPALVAVTDDEWLERVDFSARVEALLAAGLPALWLRAGRLAAGPLYDVALAARAATAAHGAELWIGDRADVARLAGADCLQLPERGLPAVAARSVLAPGTRVGRSVHGVEAAVAAAREGTDHVVVGTIWATASHPGVEPGGAERIRAVRAALAGPGSPPALYAIGGIEPGRAREARVAGADGVVALRALRDAPDPAAAVARFLDELDAAAGEPIRLDEG